MNRIRRSLSLSEPKPFDAGEILTQFSIFSVAPRRQPWRALFLGIVFGGLTVGWVGMIAMVALTVIWG